MSQPRHRHVHHTGFQEVITIDKHKATFRLLISQAMVEKMIVMPRLIKDNSKVHFDMIYPTGFQDVIVDVIVVKAIVTDKIFTTDCAEKWAVLLRNITMNGDVRFASHIPQQAKHLASANKSDKTVMNLIWLHKDTFAIHIFS